MMRRYVRRLFFPVPLVLLQRCLDIWAGADPEAPEVMLLHAVAGRVTSGGVSAFVLTWECVAFLLLFLVLYGDFIAEQQRTGAVYRFSRIPSRGPWFCRQVFSLGGYACGYCGIYVALHGAISAVLSEGACGPRFYGTVLSLWLIFSLIAFGFSVGCNFMCGRFGASVGIVGICLTLALAAALSTQLGVPDWVSVVNPASFSETFFTDRAMTLQKLGALCLEVLLVTVPAGRYFSTCDIFTVEGEG